MREAPHLFRAHGDLIWRCARGAGSVVGKPPFLGLSHACQEFPEFGFDLDLRGSVEGGGDLLEKQLAPALAEAEDAGLERGDGSAGGGGDFFVAFLRVGAETEEGTQCVEERGFAIGVVFGAQEIEGMIEDRERPAALVKAVGCEVIDGLGSVGFLGAKRIKGASTAAPRFCAIARS